jgi:hypothetical protein
MLPFTTMGDANAELFFNAFHAHASRRRRSRQRAALEDHDAAITLPRPQVDRREMRSKLAEAVIFAWRPQGQSAAWLLLSRPASSHESVWRKPWPIARAPNMVP